MRVREHQDGSGEFVFGDCLFCAHEIVVPVDGRADWTHFRGYKLKTKRKCGPMYCQHTPREPHVASPTLETFVKLEKFKNPLLDVERRLLHFKEMYDL